MQAVKSSNIDAVAYEGGDLLVRFKSGALYRYAGVPSTVFAQILNAKSVGSFFAKHVRSQYKHTKEKDDAGRS